MRKISYCILISILLIGVYTAGVEAFIGKIIGIDAIKKDVKNIKEQTVNNNQKYEGLIGANKNKIGSLEDSVIQLENKIDVNVEAKLADLSKKQEIQAGGDVFYNDPKVLYTIIGVLNGIILFLLRGMRADKKWLQGLLFSNMKKDKVIEKYMKGGPTTLSDDEVEKCYKKSKEEAK